MDSQDSQTTTPSGLPIRMGRSLRGTIGLPLDCPQPRPHPQGSYGGGRGVMRWTRMVGPMIAATAIAGTAIPGTAIVRAATPGIAMPGITLGIALPGREDERKEGTTVLARASNSGEVSQAMAMVGQIERAWKQQYEAYFEGRLTTNMLSVPQIQRVLAQRDRLTGTRSALIYLVPQQQQVLVIGLTGRGNVQVHRVAVAETQLNQTVAAFRQALLTPTSAASRYLGPGRQLYQWLMAPLMRELERQGVDTLVFCLGTGLRSVPLAALHDGQGFLGDRYSLGIIPAFNLLNPEVKDLRQAQVLAMGASQFTQLGPLPAVPLELQEVTAEPWRGEVWLNQDFTLAQMQRRRRAESFGIVHLATHADITAGRVGESFIQFWDQRLGLDQLDRLGLRSPTVELLVLSACRTALGNAQAELGFAGLAVQSGAKAVVASLWAVDDAATLALMTQFYEALHRAPTKAIAIQQAQRALRQGALPGAPPGAPQGNASADFSHPYFWAGFTVVGNPW